MYSKLRDKEAGFIQEQVQTEARKIESVLRNQVNERVASLGRMAAPSELAGLGKGRSMIERL